MNLLTHSNRILQMGDRPIARPPSTQVSTTEKNADIHPGLERDSSHWSQCSSGSCLRLRGDWDRNTSSYLSPL